MKDKTIINRPQVRQLHCMYLNPLGIQCKNYSSRRGNYHGDAEMYNAKNMEDDCAIWVRVHFCKRHFDATKPSLI